MLSVAQQKTLAERVGPCWTADRTVRERLLMPLVMRGLCLVSPARGVYLRKKGMIRQVTGIAVAEA